MSKVLITGATGFVGSCLARRLLKLGNDVHIFTRKESNKWRIKDILSHLTEHEVDLRNSESTKQVVKNIRPEIIYHLATYGGLSEQKNTDIIYESNIIGTTNILNACVKVGFGCFVNTGSSSEYGLKFEPMVEEDILEPVGEYAMSKAVSTILCRSKAIITGLPIVTLRLFSPYGPWDSPDRLIPYVIKSLIDGDQPKLSKPDFVRDYVFIEDVLDAYIAATKNPHSGLIFNIGSGKQHTIGEVVCILQEIIKPKNCFPLWGKIEQQRPEPMIWIADIKKAETMLGWKPSTTIRQGLEKTVEWMRGRYDH